MLTSRWTPLHLQLFLHYVCIAEPWGIPSSAATDYTADLVRCGLIKANENRDSQFEVTDAGIVFLAALESTPVPVQTWAMPATD